MIYVMKFVRLRVIWINESNSGINNLMIQSNVQLEIGNGSIQQF